MDEVVPPLLHCTKMATFCHSEVTLSRWSFANGPWSINSWPNLGNKILTRLHLVIHKKQSPFILYSPCNALIRVLSDSESSYQATQHLDCKTKFYNRYFHKNTAFRKALTWEKNNNRCCCNLQMNLREIFIPRADLHNVAEGEHLYVSKVVQKTFINVHENGTEAAAATGETFVCS